MEDVQSKVSSGPISLYSEFVDLIDMNDQEEYNQEYIDIIDTYNQEDYNQEDYDQEEYNQEEYNQEYIDIIDTYDQEDYDQEQYDQEDYDQEERRQELRKILKKVMNRQIADKIENSGSNYTQPRGEQNKFNPSPLRWGQNIEDDNPEEVEENRVSICSTECVAGDSLSERNFTINSFKDSVREQATSEVHKGEIGIENNKMLRDKKAVSRLGKIKNKFKIVCERIKGNAKVVFHRKKAVFAKQNRRMAAANNVDGGKAIPIFSSEERLQLPGQVQYQGQYKEQSLKKSLERPPRRESLDENRMPKGGYTFSG